MLTAIALVALFANVVPASDPNVRLIGRFDTRDTAGPRCAWPASTIELRYQGKDIVVRIRESGEDLLQIEVDGKPTQVIQLKKGEDAYTVNVPSAGVHTVRLVKRTEAFVGTTQFLTFKIPGGKLLKAVAPKRRIEVIGDSISCGYGNEGPSQNERFKPQTENAYFAYGPIAARALGADWTIVAWSGRKMWPDNTIPEIYDLAIPTDPASAWSFLGPKPDAVVINLATNDFGAGNPDEAKWTGAYEAFIARLRLHYPNAMVYCAIGSMMNDDYPAQNRALTTLRGYLTKMVARLNGRGVNKVRLIEFSGQKFEDGIGSDWHPSVKTHQKMSAVLVQRLKQDLHW